MLTIERSKRRIEAITVVADFSDRLAPGDSVFDATVSIEVFSGDDPSPSGMLYLPLIIAPEAVSQRVRWGVVGVVYNVQFSVLTSKGLTLEQTTRVAVLPDAPDAIPQIFPLFYTSRPYPIEVSESFTGTGLLTSGRFLPHIIIAPEGFKTAGLITAGTFFGSSTTYNIPYESFKSAGMITSGTFYGSVGSYAIPAEGFTGTGMLMSGTIYSNSVSYANPAEGFKSAGMITGGSFV